MGNFLPEGHCSQDRLIQPDLAKKNECIVSIMEESGGDGFRHGYI